jgi:hypothetical protein
MVRHFLSTHAVRIALPTLLLSLGLTAQVLR